MPRKNTREMVGGCCVCSDESGWAENPLVYCDGQGCNVAVHQGMCQFLCYKKMGTPKNLIFYIIENLFRLNHSFFSAIFRFSEGILTEF